MKKVVVVVVVGEDIQSPVFLLASAFVEKEDKEDKEDWAKSRLWYVLLTELNYCVLK